MDNRMPIMDGFQATILIRKPDSPVLDHDIYIIALTANASSNYRQQCLQSGMQSYLTKPIRDDELKTAFKEAIAYNQKRGHHTTLPTDFVTNKEIQNPTPPPQQPTIDSLPTPTGMSEAELLALLDEPIPTPVDATAHLAPHIRIEISRQFLEETPLLLNSLRQAWGTRDTETVGRTGHTLKSSARYVNSPRISELGKQIETLAEEQRLDDIVPLMSEIDRELTALQSHINSQS
jgi:CheY-like chemotaxis protein